MPAKWWELGLNRSTSLETLRVVEHILVDVHIDHGDVLIRIGRQGDAMRGVMARPLWMPWRHLMFGLVFVAFNVVLLSNDVVRYFLVLPHDWHVLTELPDRLATGRLFGYARDC